LADVFHLCGSNQLDNRLESAHVLPAATVSTTIINRHVCPPRQRG
jgi:hypothetical protein